MIHDLSRRRFFTNVFAGFSMPGLQRILGWRSGAISAITRPARIQASLKVRTEAAMEQASRPLASGKSNGDEDAVPGRVACYAKGLPQNRYSEVEPAAYDSLLRAVNSGRFQDFERITRGGGRRLSNPQSAYAFHLEGGDPHTFNIAPAPVLHSKELLPDVSWLYWQALCRDIPFVDYANSPTTNEAAKDLSSSPQNLFRWKTNLGGPYISQFLLKPIPFGAQRIEQRYSFPAASSDFMTAFDEWSQIQAGFLPWRVATYNSNPRYISDGRDLAEYVHYDFAYQAYLSAALILINSSAQSILNCNQFKSSNNPYRSSTVEEGFATFGPAEVVDWLGRVTTAALKPAYYQKWMVHRRLRPEALGGLIHQRRMGTRKYPLHDSVLESAGVEQVFKHTGSYLLPQAYPEGSPTHPSYPSGHAAIAGACSVILKACFDGAMLFPDCVEPASDGLSLMACKKYAPTVNDEIDKLASNISMGREWAGIHYRSDSIAGLALGEEVGISILQDLACTFSEDFDGFSFRRFNGNQIHISPHGQIAQ
jgi:hypothetical protein